MRFSEVLTEREILQHELKQVHAQAVREDEKKRLHTKWDLQVHDARLALYRVPA